MANAYPTHVWCRIRALKISTMVRLLLCLNLPPGVCTPSPSFCHKDWLLLKSTALVCLRCAELEASRFAKPGCFRISKERF